MIQVIYEHWSYLTAFSLVALILGATLGWTFYVLRYRAARRRIENHHTADENFYNTFLQSSTPALLLDENRFIDCNEAAVKMTGCASRDELLGKHPAMLSPITQPDGQLSLQKAHRMIQEAIQSGHHFFEWAHQHSDGTIFIVEVTLSTLPYQGRHLLMALWRDVTERKKIEKNLQMLDYAIDRSADAIYVIQQDRRFVYVNLAACKMLGYTREQLCALSLDEVDSDLTNLNWDVVWNQVRQEDNTLIQRKHRRKNGQLVPVEIISSIFTYEGTEYICSIVRDRTEQIKRQREIEEREQRFQAIFHETYQFIGLLTPTGTVIETNQAALKFAGLKLEDVAGRPFWETPWWSHSPVAQKKLRSAIYQATRGKFIRFETETCGKGGQLVTIDFSLKPVFDSRGNVTMLIPEGRDISDRKKSEQAIQESYALLEGTINALSEQLAILDLDGKVITANQAWTRFVRDYELTEDRRIIGADLFDILIKIRNECEDDQDALAHMINEARSILQGRNAHYSMVYRFSRNGQQLWFHLQFIRFTSGGKSQIVVTQHDITDRKQWESHLQEREEMLRTINNTAMEAIVVIDDKGHIWNWNLAAQKIFGYTADEVRGRDVHTLLAPEQYRRVANLGMARFAMSGKGQNLGRMLSVEACKRDGSTFPIQVTVAPMHIKDRWWAVATIRDITSRKKTQQDLKERTQQLDHMTQIHRAALAVVDHEGMIITANPGWHELWTEIDGDMDTRQLEKAMFAYCRQAAERISHPLIHTLANDVFSHPVENDDPVLLEYIATADNGEPDTYRLRAMPFRCEESVHWILIHEPVEAPSNDTSFCQTALSNSTS